MPQRSTSQRRAIREVFENADRPLATQEVLEAAQQLKPGLGIATVYRALKRLGDEGWLKTVKLPGVPPRYEMVDLPHHHHFYCESCERVYRIPGSPQLLDSSVPAGFELENHDLVLYGTCHECNAGDSERGTVPSAEAG